MHNHEFKFGYQHFLLCQKSFLKVSSKWLLKNKSDNGKLLLGKTYSGERFRAILALLFLKNAHDSAVGADEVHYQLFKHLPRISIQTLLTLSQTSPGFYVSAVHLY